MVHITALLMIKNESDRIAVTLESLNVDCIDRIAIYDTGSGDDTLDICNSFTNKEMVIKEGPWINFEFSRNKALEWVQNIPDTEWILLLDGNDELKNIESLRNELDTNYLSSGLYLNREWEKSGVVAKDKIIRIIRANTGWKYIGCVYEVLINHNLDNILLSESRSILYQNRDYREKRLVKRLEWDKEVLNEEYKDKGNARTLYYLAETYFKLKEYEQALLLYSTRTGMEDGSEQCYLSYISSANINLLLNKNHEAINCFTQASLFAENTLKEFRPLPIIEIGRIYRLSKLYHMANMYFNMAVKFVECLKDDFSKFTLWNELSICNWHNRDYQLGLDSCKEALKLAKNDDQIKIVKENISTFPSNLAMLQHCYYINLQERTDRKEYVEKELEKIGIPNLTRFDAIKYNLGAVGCLESHVRVLEQFLSLENSGEFVSIFEDDVKILEPALLLSGLLQLEKDNDWNVLMMSGCNMDQYEKYKNYPCVKIRKCQSCAAYVVRKNYVPTLLNLWKVNLDAAFSSNEDNVVHTDINADYIWNTLQEKDIFILLSPIPVCQISGYSDIERVYKNMFTNEQLSLDYNLNKELNLSDIDKLDIVSDGLVVKESLLKNAGKGLFTDKYIAKGSIICEYTGELLEVENCDNLRKILQGDYILSLGQNKYINAEDTSYALGRYINDPRNNKLENSIYILSPERNKAYVVSTKNINPSEEIYVYYGSYYWHSR